MKATWDKLDKNWMGFEIEVEAEQFANAVNRAYQKLVKKVKVPGFRPGKAPRIVLERTVGKEALHQEALEILVPEVYEEAVQAHNIEPINQPELDLDQFEEGKPLILKGKVEVKPEVQLGKLVGFELEETPSEVTEQEIDAQLESLRDRVASLQTDEGGEIKEKSFAVIDFEGFVDGVPFEGGKAENYTLEVGSGTFIPGFEDQLVGAKVGEERDVKVTFPTEYHSEQLAGKDASFKVKVQEVKCKQLPDLDDAFAAEVSKFQTLDELRSDIAKRLQEEAAQKADRNFRNKLVEAVAADAKLEVPHTLVHSRVHDMLHDFEQRLASQGMNLELYSQITGKTHDVLHDEFHEPAEKAVRADLVMEAVAKQEGLTVEEAEVDAEFNQMAALYKSQVAQIRQLQKSRSYRDRVRTDLMLRKAVEHLVRLNKTPQEQAG